MAKFRGYFSTDATCTETTGFPTEVDNGDCVIGVYQNPEDASTRLSRIFTYVNNGWTYNVEEEPLPLYSVNPSFVPFEERSLNIYEPYGMGLFSMVFVYVDISALRTWAGSADVGNDDVILDNLEFHDIFTGAKIDNYNAPSTIGLLPVYIRNGEQIVGVGSAVFVGSWRVLWHKMNMTSGAPPTINSDTETVLADYQFIMTGNTTAFHLILYDADYVPHEITGDKVVWNGTTTKYNLLSYQDTWTSLVLKSPSNVVVYKMTNMNLATIRSLALDQSSMYDDFSLWLITLEGNQSDFVPRAITQSLVKGVGVDVSTGQVKITYPSVTLADGTVTTPTVAIPAVTLTGDGCEGMMTPALLQDLITVQSEIATLKNAGGKWIGQNFATYDDLLLFVDFPNSYNIADYTYVLSDRTQGGVRTIYAVAPYDAQCVVQSLDDTKGIKFTRADEATPIEIATEADPGTVRSAASDGTVSVNPSTGVMSLNGYAAILSAISGLVGRVEDLEEAIVRKEGTYSAPTGAPLNGKTLSAALDYINGVLNGTNAATINHTQ